MRHTNPIGADETDIVDGVQPQILFLASDHRKAIKSVDVLETTPGLVFFIYKHEVLLDPAGDDLVGNFGYRRHALQDNRF